MPNNMNEQTPVLPPDYYLRNFESVMSWARTRYQDILEPEELECLAAFDALPHMARCLYVRLYLRRGPLFRLSGLSYAEIDSIDEALRQLEEAEFVMIGGQALAATGVETGFASLRVAELSQLALSLGLDPPRRKDDLLALLNEDAAAALALLHVDVFIYPAQQELFARLQVLFFGNRHQDLSTLVVADLEHTRYANYPLDHEQRVFADREALESYLEAAFMLEEAMDELEADDLPSLADSALHAVVGSTRPIPYRRAVDPARYYARLAHKCARELERVGEMESAAGFYERLVTHAPELSTRARAAERLGLVCGRIKQVERFDPPSAALLADEDLSVVDRFTIKLRRSRLGLSPDPRVTLRRPAELDLELEAVGHRGSKALYKGPQGASVSIEVAVLEHLGGEGLLAENSLWRTIFGLLMWDVVFAPLPGVFQQPYQGAPLDFGDARFFSARRQLFSARLQQLDQGDPVAELELSRRKNQGVSCRLVDWRAYGRAELVRVVSTVGRPLIGLLEHLARHPRRHGRGLPDLFFWKDGRPLLVEVKGPGDQVSIEQSLWHDKLIRLGLDVSIARVRTP